MGPELLTLFCPTCGHDRLAEAPPCPDGHGDDCPDRACVECGTALLLDAPLFDLAAGRERRSTRRAGGSTGHRIARSAA
jgi:hypothetical protein